MIQLQKFIKEDYYSLFKCREAKVGDFVVGKGYNKGKIAGVMLSITPNSPSCNCVVGIIRLKDETIMNGLTATMLYRDVGSGKENVLVFDVDYSQTDYFLHVEDVDFDVENIFQE